MWVTPKINAFLDIPFGQLDAWQQKIRSPQLR
jgi:hypothetical protein